MEVAQNILGTINKCPIELRPTTAFAYMFLASFSHTIDNSRRFVVIVSVGYCDKLHMQYKIF